MSKKLHRFGTYPHEKIHEDVRRVRTLENRDGNTIELKITDDLRGTFHLKYGRYQIVDNLADFWDRKHLYDLLDEDLFDWLVEVKKSFETEQLEEVGVVKVTMNNNNDKYELSVNKKTRAGMLRIPEQLREFKLDDIFVENPDLPLLLDGRLIQNFVEKLGDHSIVIPDIPYYPGLKMTEKPSSSL